MAQKNEIPVLLASIVITASLLGGGYWLLTQKMGLDLNRLIQPNASPVRNSPTTTASKTPQAATFQQVANVPPGLFSYGGSTTWAPIRRDVDRVITSNLGNFQLRYTEPTTGAPGSSIGIKMLLNNQLAFVQSSRSIKTEEYEDAQRRGFTLKEIPVAIDGIAIGINPNLNVRGLTVDQLRDIYLGKLTNWNQVGGPNLAITPYSRRIEEGGTIEFFVENVLEGKPFGPTVQWIATTTEALRAVSANPGGLYYASAPELVPQCTVKPLPIGRNVSELVAPYTEPLIATSACPSQRNQLNSTAFQNGSYPITRRLFVIVKQNGQVDQQAGEAYANLLLTDQGQELITRSGFVRIR